MHILVTGANGFIGSNLIARLAEIDDVIVTTLDRENTQAELDQGLAVADVIIHLAGINRPESEREFRTGNVDFTVAICEKLTTLGRSVPLLFSSSVQVERDNPYGRSKLAAEEVIMRYAEQAQVPVTIFRLTNVFGKWCRPNYNSVVATFCYNVARDLPIAISDPNHVISLVHVDDVVQALLDGARASTSPGAHYREVEPVYDISLEMLAEALKEFRTARDTLLVPNLGDPLMQRLYSTYLSYLPEDQFAYDLEQRSDPRGSLAEFVKSEPFGQIFVSRTNPGITRGNHYHHIKSEKFLVLEGEAIVRFRHILHDTVLEYPVNGKAFRVIDIPPGYTHSIENVGASELVTLFWASEIFDSAHPDTNYMDVLSTL